MRWKLLIFNKMLFKLFRMDLKNYFQIKNNHLIVINLGNISIRYRTVLGLLAEVIQNNNSLLKNGWNFGKRSFQNLIVNLICIC